MEITLNANFLAITSTTAVTLYLAGLLASQFAAIVGWFC